MKAPEGLTIHPAFLAQMNAINTALATASAARKYRAREEAAAHLLRLAKDVFNKSKFRELIILCGGVKLVVDIIRVGNENPIAAGRKKTVTDASKVLHHLLKHAMAHEQLRKSRHISNFVTQYHQVPADDPSKAVLDRVMDDIQKLGGGGGGAAAAGDRASIATLVTRAKVEGANALHPSFILIRSGEIDEILAGLNNIIGVSDPTLTQEVDAGAAASEFAGAGVAIQRYNCVLTEEQAETLSGLLGHADPRVQATAAQAITQLVHVDNNRRVLSYLGTLSKLRHLVKGGTEAASLHATETLLTLSSQERHKPSQRPDFLATVSQLLTLSQSETEAIRNKALAIMEQLIDRGMNQELTEAGVIIPFFAVVCDFAMDADIRRQKGDILCALLKGRQPQLTPNVPVEKLLELARCPAPHPADVALRLLHGFMDAGKHSRDNCAILYAREAMPVLVELVTSGAAEVQSAALAGAHQMLFCRPHDARLDVAATTTQLLHCVTPDLPTDAQDLALEALSYLARYDTADAVTVIDYDALPVLDKLHSAQAMTAPALTFLGTVAQTLADRESVLAGHTLAALRQSLSDEGLTERAIATIQLLIKRNNPMAKQLADSGFIELLITYFKEGSGSKRPAVNALKWMVATDPVHAHKLTKAGVALAAASGEMDRVGSHRFTANMRAALEGALGRLRKRGSHRQRREEAVARVGGGGGGGGAPEGEGFGLH